MTIPTYTGLNTALSGLEAMQAGIDTTGENISNASTPGYAEQQVNLTDSSSLLLWPGTDDGSGVQLGTGVTVSSITREDDLFLDQQYWTQNAASSNASTLANQLSDLQSDLDDSSTTGISSQLSTFFQAFNSLANDPTSSSSAAQNVVSNGSTLIQMFNGLSSEMSTLQGQAQTQLSTLTDPSSGEVAQYADQIAQLNQQISGQAASGTSANELEDERSQALNSLSALVTVTVTANSNGADTVTLADGTKLVNGTVSDPTSAVTLPASYSAGDGGEIGALASLASSSGPIGTLSTQLDSVASTVAGDVNALLPSSSPFFTGTTASTIALASTATASSLATVAASQSVTPSGGGATTTGSDIMQQISALSDTATNSYSGFIAQIGDAVDAANDANTTGQSLLTSISNQVQSVSGVSLDDEMTNLITYQQGYEASARVMNTMQSVLQTLISSVGSAGL